MKSRKRFSNRLALALLACSIAAGLSGDALWAGPAEQATPKEAAAASRGASGGQTPPLLRGKTKVLLPSNTR